MTVTVIIPVYNTAPYLDEALTSICAAGQDCDLQIICVDDGSTDESLAILHHWAANDQRIMVLHQENQGQSVARNLAMKHIRGEWVFFFDSDDVLAPEALKTALSHALQTNAQLVLFEGDIINGEGRPVVSDRYHRITRFADDRLYTGEEVMTTLLDTFSFRAVPWLYLVRTDYLRLSGLRFRPGIIHEDEPFTAALLLGATSIAVLHRRLVHHRIRQDSTMGLHFTRRNMDCILAAIDEMVTWTAAHPDHATTARRYCRYTLTHVLITARQLSLRDRAATLHHIIRAGYLPFVEMRRLAAFIIGQWHRRQSSYISELIK